mmetsp:Transcript_22404/g.45357  ORF Transcript_22404/g.45357 Transcript_22404/m.45357 type:complete len:206 (-) Transcript_22404:453-1070(-)
MVAFACFVLTEARNHPRGFITAIIIAVFITNRFFIARPIIIFFSRTLCHLQIVPAKKQWFHIRVLCPVCDPLTLTINITMIAFPCVLSTKIWYSPRWLMTPLISAVIRTHVITGARTPVSARFLWGHIFRHAVVTPTVQSLQLGSDVLCTRLKCCQERIPLVPLPCIRREFSVEVMKCWLAKHIRFDIQLDSLCMILNVLNERDI